MSYNLDNYRSMLVKFAMGTVTDDEISDLALWSFSQVTRHRLMLELQTNLPLDVKDDLKSEADRWELIADMLYKIKTKNKNEVLLNAVV